jgi:tripartite-type tricarboxylate transporter receptor subunit TctC
VNADPAAIIVRSDAPWKTLQEFLDDVKSRSADNKVKMSGTAIGGAWDLARAGMMRAAGVDVSAIIWVPKEGAAPSLVELLGGHLDAVCCSAAEAAAQLDAGELRALAVMSEARLPDYPDVPTVQEAGIDWVAVAWRGLAFPKGTPPEIVSKVEQKCLEIGASEEYETFMDQFHFRVKIRPAAEFREFLQQQDRQWGEVMAAVGYTES